MRDEHATPPDSLTRRRFLAGAGAVLAGGIAAGIAARRASASVDVPLVPLGTQPAHLPARQHAWSQWLNRDEYGNPLAPRYDRLLFFDVSGRPASAYVRLLESRLRTLERHFRWGPGGLLFTVSYGPEYFTPRPRRSGASAPRDQPLELRVAGD